MTQKIWLSFIVSFLTTAPWSSFAATGTGSIPSETTIWFDAPATQFTESSPLGNGRLGAMMFGGVDDERIVLNESSVWSGSQQDADHPEAWKVLPEIQKLLLQGNDSEAQDLVNANFTCNGPGSAGAQYGCYQVLGNLHLKFSYADTNQPVANYRRGLDLNNAIARMEFSRGGVRFTREMLASKPDEVMVLRLSADRPGKISFETRLDRPERFETALDGPNGLLMTGQLDNGVDGKGVRYAARVRILHQGGRISAEGNVVRLTGADEALVFISAATDYRGFAGCQLSNPDAASLEDVNRASRKSWNKILKAHVADYQKYFQRVSLEMDPPDPGMAAQPTPMRLKAAKAAGGDPSLAALYFNFGRYLLISSSRPGGLPPNLQGLWAEEIRTPWNSDWHLDVNVQMNYWPAEAVNLSDLTQPLFALIASLQKPGEKTAWNYYHARGWVAHVITNPWGFTSPGESASWGSATCGSAWLCQHLYDHYEFTHDKKFLTWAYPILKGSAQFYSDMLIEEPKHHWLVIAPANSPENHFLTPDGKDCAICMGPTMLQQLVRYLFSACIDSSEALNVDPAFRNELIQKRNRLAPTCVGPDGRVLEWLEPYREPEPQHRHVSHLWGLYPGDEISPSTTPDLAAAARKTLELRGDDGVGWSLAFKAALWARLGDGNHAWLLLQHSLYPVTSQEIRYDNGGGVYANLFDACPPFQIDANFGATAAVAEMLLQSRPGTIELLPALPDAWKTGAVSGLRARGGFTLSLQWTAGKLTRATIRSERSQPVSVRYGNRTIQLELKKSETAVLNGNLESAH